jgi:N-acetylglucosamine kinase-like BadF-type ATPase
MGLFLAIDAGGTKTECVLADDERVLARAATGTVKLMRISEEEASARLRAMLGEVAGAAGVSLGQVTRTCFGLAGLSSAAVREWAQRVVPAMVAGELVLCGDEEIALDAAFRGGAGILVVAGTGSNAIGRAANGKLYGAGGWGPILGDEGSGYWIGLESLRAALHARDLTNVLRTEEESANNRLLPAIQRHWGLSSLAELVALANHRGDADRPAPDFASLAPIVARCAQDGDQPGDPIAASVLHRAGRELAALVALVSRKIDAPNPNPPGPAPTPAAEPLAISFTGSVLSHIAPVRTSMIAHLAALVPAARVLSQPVEPLVGALWCARHP